MQKRRDLLRLGKSFEQRQLRRVLSPEPETLPEILQQIRQTIKEMGQTVKDHFPTLKVLLDKVLADRERPGEVVAVETYDGKVLRDKANRHEIPSEFLSRAVNLPDTKAIRQPKTKRRDVQRLERHPILVFAPRKEIEPDTAGKFEGQWVVLMGVSKKFNQNSDAFEIRY